MVIAAAGGPGWTDILTAIGTVGAVIVAVGIALWTERRSDRRIKEERARSDRVLAEQQAQARTAIEDERAYGRAQLEEERRIARDREQLAQAYAVQVVLAQANGKSTGVTSHGDLAPSETKQLAVMIVNRGLYTITRVEAQFCLGNAMIPHHRFQRMASLDTVPAALRAHLPLVSYQPAPEISLHGVLTPFDTGIRFETDQIHERHLVSPYPVVRWTDQWGTRWEHKRGVVHRIRDEDPWEP
jgi:hypothetical protein